MSQSKRDRVERPGATAGAPCLCYVLRKATRAVTRLYDEELRGTNLRVTQFSLLSFLGRSGEIRQGDLGERTFLDGTTLTRSLRPLAANGWVALREGADRREKLVSITEAGTLALEQARPAWLKAQARMRQALAEGQWETLLAVLPEVAQAAAEG